MDELISVVLPTRIDSQARAANLATTLRFITRELPRSEVVVIEWDRVERMKDLANAYPTVRFLYRHSEGRFCKAEAVNFGLSISSRPVFALWDIDVLVSARAVKAGAERIATGINAVVLPHNALFVNVKGRSLERLKQTLDVGAIPYIRTRKQRVATEDVNVFYTPSGVVLFDREVLLLEGGFNKHMVSYGWQDVEVLKRLARRGYFPHVAGGANVIHMDHPRSADSGRNEYFERNRTIFQKIATMSRKELRKYVDEELADGSSSRERARRVRMQFWNNLRRLNHVRYLANRVKTYVQTRGL